MLIQEGVRQLLEYYPRIFFACHTRHVRDPKTRRLLSEHQARILDHLDEIEPLSLMELAAHLGVTPGTMSLTVQRLVRHGYVTRSRDRKDARRLNLRLSPAGARVKEEHSVLDARCLQSMLGRLSPEERAAGIRGLALLARAAQEEIERGGRRGIRGLARTGKSALSRR